ncbi:MAG: recombination mediator RecR [bacterium]
MNDPLEQLIKLLSRLPGVGVKTATRLAFHLITTPKEYSAALAMALTTVAEQVKPCLRCGNFTADELCRICLDPRREDAVICVVSRVQDLLALERAGGFRGRYHVLHGLLSPLDGIGPEDINIATLVGRVAGDEGAGSSGVSEVILAISPSVEGETTVLYLSRELADLGPKVTRIAAGVPIGGELEYTDQVTLGRALADRREV